MKEDWTTQLRLTKDNKIKSDSLINAEMILENDWHLKNLIGFNEFSEYIYLLKNSKELNRSKGMWEDSFESALLSYIEANYDVIFSRSKIHDAVVNASRKRPFNPLKDRIEKVAWDRVGRVESFFIDLLGVEDNVYTREVSKRWLAGMIARVYHPGIKFEIVPVLDGEQGIGKSTITRRLVSDKFFSDSLDTLGSKKDDYLVLRENLVLELGELSSMRKTAIEKIKNFISATYDDVRDPYGHNTVKRARSCVFIGTSNDSEYLKDLTGERRFFPLPCRNQTSKNLFDLEEEYFLQVLAEAKYLFENGQPIFFDNRNVEDNEVLSIAKKYREEAKVENPMEGSIQKFLEMEVPLDWDEADIWVKKIYFKTYPKSKADNQIMNFFNTEKFRLMDRIFTSEILEIVFELNTSDLINKNVDSYTKKISLIISNLEGWEKNNIYKKGRRGKGYLNIKHKEKNKLYLS